jgi:hypothetical protein
VGYIHGIKDGKGITIWLKTEAEYQAAVSAIGGDR